MPDPNPRCVACRFAIGLEASTDASHEVLRQNEALFRAIAARDMATLERVTAPEFHFETADGAKGDRAAWLEGVRAMPYVIESIRNDDLVLRLDGERAVLCGVQRAEVRVEREIVVDEARFCDLWEHRHGQWFLTFAGAPTPPT